MARNDVVLLDSILQQRVTDAIPSDKLDEVFEYFSLEQVLKDFDLSRDEIESGWIDGRDDGGIDAFFVFLNGHLLQEPATFSWPRAGALLEVWLITCKHHATFEQAPINSMLASAQELFDLSVTRDQLKGSYSEELLKSREILAQAYRRVSIAKPEIIFRFRYVSRGDSSEVADNVTARARQLEALVASFFSSCKVEFAFIGANGLVELFRRTKQFSLDLPFIEHVSAGGGSYILLTRLDDYCRFVSDGAGNLRRYLFDSNVRDFLRGTPVNEDIAESLRTQSAPDFWWLNNGVTILATNAALSGKMISLQNIQIVNGLQTTETIYRHFQTASSSPDPRTVLVKVLVSTDSFVRDRIIRATNNQNAVELASLHATDKIQRDIEDILEKCEWYYERRKNYYRNIGKPPQRFVTPVYLASCLIALIFKNPPIAAKLKTRFMRSAVSYSSVFSEEFPLHAWPIIVGISKRVEESLSVLRTDSNELGDRFLAKWRPLVSLICVARIKGTFDYSTQDIVAFNIEAITHELVTDVWRPIKDALQSYKGKAFRNPQFTIDQCKAASIAHGLDGVGRRTLPTGGLPLDEIFLRSVAAVVSRNPALANDYKSIADQLGCNRGKVKSALYVLRKRGISAVPLPAGIKKARVHT